MEQFTDLRNQLKSEFERLFDRIYVIHLLDYADRRQDLISELYRVGLADSNKLEWYYDVKSPLDEDMYKCLSGLSNEIIGPRKLSYNHYKLIKIARALGYKRILIIEDDLRFLKDLEKAYQILRAYPENADICLLDKVVNVDFDCCPASLISAARNHMGDYAYYHIGEISSMASSACYGLTGAGMDYIVNSVEALYKNPHVVTMQRGAETKDIQLNFMNSDHFLNSSYKDYLGGGTPAEIMEQVTLQYKPEIPPVFAYSLYNIGVQMSLVNTFNTFNILYIGYKFLDLSKYNIDPSILTGEKNYNRHGQNR